MRVKSSTRKADDELLVNLNVDTHFDDGGGRPPRGTDRHQLNAILAIDFSHARARRYIIRQGFGTRPFPVYADEFTITGMLRRFDVEHVRRTGRLELQGDTA